MTKTLAAIDHNLEVRQGKGFRAHLGASVLGDDCWRKIWYTFHWAREVRHQARLLRLFSRGELEEIRFVKWLQGAGVHVVTHNPDDINPETGDFRQHRVTFAFGHGGGSLDAQLYDSPDFPGEWILGEFKTHNDKSFQDLKKRGVRVSKPVHEAQVQVYMLGRGLRACLYMAINKNDDALYTEIVYLDEERARNLMMKAEAIVKAESPPKRISESAAWYQCRFCDFFDVCHMGAPMAFNCRTCIFAQPVDNGKWLCTRHNYPLAEADQRRGCTDWTPYEGPRTQIAAK